MEKLEHSTLCGILGDLATHTKFIQDYQSTLTKEQLIAEIINMNDIIDRFGSPLEDWQKDSHAKRTIWENS